MDISYFREFVVLAETLNYWAAAERLFIGQSSLSKHIKTLEKQLGAPLFDRSSRKVELTEFGRWMLPYAQSVAKLQQEYESAAFTYLHRENEPLTIGTIPVIARYNITDILIQFQRSHPTIPVKLQEADTLIVRQWLLEHKCHIGIFRGSAAYSEQDPEQEAKLVKIPYRNDRLLAVLPRDHPLAGEKELTLSQLDRENFALIQQDTMPYELCIRACREAGFTPRVVFNSHSLEAILDMVRKGNCVSLLFTNHISFSQDQTSGERPSFAAVPVTPAIHSTVYLGYLKNARLSPAAQQFIEYCKMNKLD